MDTFKQAVARTTTEKLTALRDLTIAEKYDEDKIPLSQTDVMQYEELIGLDNDEFQDMIDSALFSADGKAEDPETQSLISNYK